MAGYQPEFIDTADVTWAREGRGLSLLAFLSASPAASWYPTHNPNYGSSISPVVQRNQPIDMAGSNVYSYNKGRIAPISLRWENLPSADLVTLLAFFATLSGGAHTFTYADPYENRHTARLLNPDNLPHRYAQEARHSISLELEVAV
jgi:hypothetical protein